MAPQSGETAAMPRVLCLTGTASGKKIMEVQMSKLFKEAKGKVEFVIYEGTKECTMEEPLEIMGSFFKGLPMMMYDELTFDDRNWRCYKDVRGTLKTLQKVLKEQGPFDGVMGFSQGANFAVMLVAQSYVGAGRPLSFVVALCPNAPGYTGQLPELFEETLPAPALIVRGAQEGYDEGVKKTLNGAKIETLGEEVVSEHVVKLFSGPEVFTHPDGHRPLPTKPKDQAELVDKILDFILETASSPPVLKSSKGEWSGKPLWRVAEGAGGRLVRRGCGLGTKELVETLRPGALVEELDLRGSRLHYRLIAGAGPDTGWVTTKAKAGELLQRAPDEAAGLTGEIWIVTMGTRGDLQPFVVLGMALQEAGYTVRLFGPPELSSFSAASGLRFTVSCAGWSDGRDSRDELVKQAAEQGNSAAAQGESAEQQASAADDEQNDAGEEAALDEHEGNEEGNEEGERGEAEAAGQSGAQPFINFLQAIGVDTSNQGDVGHLWWLWTEMPKTISILSQEMDVKKPDLLIYNHLMVNVGQLLWRRDRVRTMFANLGMEFHFAPSGKDIFNFKTLTAFDRFVVRPITGLCPLAEMSKEKFDGIYYSPDRLLGTTKLIREVLPIEAQAMSKEWKFTGFWVMESDRQRQEPGAFGGPEVFAALEKFLARGDPPVYMGWGSMPVPPGLLVVAVKALRSLGVRAVIVKGWGNYSFEVLQKEAAASSPDDCEELCEFARERVLFLEKAPHEWLFPRCSCTVHHGGAGTTAAALRAGVPTVVVPVAYDQWYHGDWVVKLGVGVKASKYDEVDPAELAEALTKATRDREMQKKAQAVSEALRREPGVTGAVAKVRQVLRDDVRSGAAQARWQAEEDTRRLEKQRRAERLMKLRAERNKQRQPQAAGEANGQQFDPPSRK